jgi:hypothetical protein
MYRLFGGDQALLLDTGAGSERCVFIGPGLDLDV